MHQPLVTVRETFNKDMQFLIPEYQRGYKWTVTEVRKLLEDVESFSVGSGLEYYCLQNLTLVRNIQKPNLLKVVDGQQRLTTSSIIISYMRYRNVEKLPVLKNGHEIQLSFGECKKTTTQHFFEYKVLNGEIWRDVDGLDVVEDDVWMTHEYIDDISKKLHSLFEQWLVQNSTSDYNHSDIFHMFCAAMTVAAFFQQGRHLTLDDFSRKFLDEVRFLHNILEETLSIQDTGASILEAEVFSKINGFRVPLDGADLLRAIFITYAVDYNSLESGVTEYEVRLNEARVKVGLELDTINAWWQEPRHRKYFAMFDPYKGMKDVDAGFDAKRYPINLLYRLFAATKGAKTVSVDWFERNTSSVRVLYDEIRHFHSVLMDWYEDIRLYHYAGFLVGQGGSKFAKDDASSLECGIYNLLGQCPRRFDLFKTLKTRIFLEVTRHKEKEEAEEGISEENLTALTTAITGPEHNWYAEEIYSVKKVLVLLDVIAFAESECLVNDIEEKQQIVLKKRNPLANHLDPEFFTCQGEDKEHIFPQTPIGGKDRRSFEELQNKVIRYWNLICKTATGKTENTLREEWEKYWMEEESFQNISSVPFPISELTKERYDWLFSDEKYSTETIRRINEFVMKVCKIDLNSIGNIVMLDSGINRGYGNNFFTEKRKEIWAQYRRCQPVRLHTYRVFAKEFPDDTIGLDVWGQASIEANRLAIKKGIVNYFKELFDKQEIP